MKPEEEKVALHHPKHRKGVKKGHWPTLIAVSISLIGVILLSALLIVNKEENPPAPEGTTTSQTATQESKVMIVNGGSFEPSQIGVDRGTTVMWTNEDSVAHDLHIRDTQGESLDNFGTGNTLAPKDTYAYVFEEAGTYYVYDSANPSITGNVIVK